MKINIRLILCCLIVVGASLSLASCASMFGKSSYPLYISAQPTGADINITDQKGQTVYDGQSPATVMLKSSSDYLKSATYNVAISYPGYKAQNITVTSKINGWYWANIAFGGLIGMLIVDPLTGAMYKLDNTRINVVLQEETQNRNLSENELNIIHINDLPENMKEYLVKIN